jgi:hypothetical protein
MAARHDEDGGVLGLVGGFGILLVQASALIPGLLPALLLALPLVLPVVLLGVFAGLVVLVSRGIWRLVTAGAAVLSRAVQAAFDQGVDDEGVRSRRDRRDRQAAGAAVGCRGT